MCSNIITGNRRCATRAREPVTGSRVEETADSMVVVAFSATLRFCWKQFVHPWPLRGQLGRSNGSWRLFHDPISEIQYG
jgi:hypothetical protein